MKRKKKKFLGKIIAVICVLCIGAFCYFGYRTYNQVQDVMDWRSVVQKEADKQEASEQTDLILAVIFTESKGEALDVMQSSESKYGNLEEITSSEESVESGVDFFVQAVKKAETKNCDIWTAVQAYNFGLAYIDYVAEHGGENSVKLAEEYSKTVLAPLLGNTEQNTYRYLHPMAIIHNGGYLYENGGNIFYADIVRLNQKILNLFSK